jgi:hypothetical protein
LSKRRRGKDAVDEVRCLRGHAPARAARTKAAILTRERDQQVVAAARARRVHEAARKITAAQVASELVLYVPRQWALVGLACMAEKVVPVLLHQPIEHRLVRTAWNVRGGEAGHSPAVAFGVPMPRPNGLACLRVLSGVQDSSWCPMDSVTGHRSVARHGIAISTSEIFVTLW